MAFVKLENIYVSAVDLQKRALSFREMLLTKSSFASSELPILRGLTIEASPGDRIGLVGKNGSGKSSILKVIAGNYPHHKGNRSIDGRVAPLIEMGVGFDLELTGRENIKLGLVYSGRLKDFSQNLVDRVIEFSELRLSIDQPMKTYSSGMVARLAFSVAVMQEPDILLLDEVLATGDAYFVKKSKKYILDKLEKTPISIMVNHSHNDIIELCNKCYLIENGKVIMEGDPKTVVNHYLGESGE